MYNTEPGLYMVSTWGRILNTRTGMFIPRELTRDTNRYIHIAIRDVNNNEVHVRMHQVMCYMFVPMKPISIDGGLIVPNHKDGVKWHNEPYNLEWVTLSENTMHADSNNLISRAYGEDNGFAALTDEQYLEIGRLTQEGYLAHEINKIMNVGFDITNIAQKIRNGSSATWLQDIYDFSSIPTNDYKKFSDDQVRYIATCLQDNPTLSYNNILVSMGYDIEYMDKKAVKKLRDTISCIKRRKSYTEITKYYNF